MRAIVVAGWMALLGCSSSPPGSGPLGDPFGAGGSGSNGTGGGGNASGGNAGSAGAVPSKVAVSKEVCSAFCKAGHSLGCANDPQSDESCRALCNGLGASVPPCAEKGEAWLACVAKDANNLECNEDGVPSLGPNAQEGACRTPFNELLACACTGHELSYQPDLETARAGCKKGCSAQSSISCADPDCASTCDALDPMSYSWPVASALYECMAEQPQLTYECSDQENPTLAGESLACNWALFTGLYCGLSTIVACMEDVCLAPCEDNMCQGGPMSPDCKSCMTATLLSAE